MPKDNLNAGQEWSVIDDIIPPSDELIALTRPPELGPTYKERECDNAADEQVPLHIAQGELEARPFDRTVAENEAPASTASVQLDHAAQEHFQKVARRDEAKKKLLPFAARPKHGEVTYHVRLAGLLFGDVAGISGAAILLGETPVNAIGQATSAAVAAITLGAIGTEVKRLVQTRSRAAAAAKLDKTYDQYSRFFATTTKVDAIVKAVVFGALAGITVIAGAIFTLRDTTEGGAAGICFGLLALAIGLASFLNSYSTTACEVCDYLDQLDQDVADSQAELEARKSDPYLKAHAGAAAEAKNIRATWTALGEAAKLGRLREKFGILSKNPRIVGHGVAVPVRTIPLDAFEPTAVGNLNGNHSKGQTSG